MNTPSIRKFAKADRAQMVALWKTGQLLKVGQEVEDYDDALSIFKGMTEGNPDVESFCTYYDDPPEIVVTSAETQLSFQAYGMIATSFSPPFVNRIMQLVHAPGFTVLVKSFLRSLFED